MLTVADVGMESCYSLTNSRHLTAEETYHCEQNTFATGACFAEIEVDLALGQIHVLRLSMYMTADGSSIPSSPRHRYTAV